MVPNQSYLQATRPSRPSLDVETGEDGLPELIPSGAGGVDSVAPVLTTLGVRPARPRAGRNALVSVRLTEAARLTIRLDVRRGTRWRRVSSILRPGRAGGNTVKVGLRVRRSGRRRPVSAGRYRVVVRAVDTAGNSSRDLTRVFRVVR